ncbi:HotDog domain containing protein [Parasponia andersonii]|uniref:Acyl-coenzyme A thioesterase 13 n=1 Tax=Parasponia andersonii TaxID=3476 RepID=A0A2P5B1S8_PARAD|nr:HotDog domain containing protein [Parasponia andersonii]
MVQTIGPFRYQSLQPNPDPDKGSTSPSQVPESPESGEELSSEEQGGQTQNSRLKGAKSKMEKDFALRGIRVDRFEPGLVACTLKVPPRLTDRNGRLASGAIANMVDAVGASVVHAERLPMNVSVDMSISFQSTAKAELEITSSTLGLTGGYSGTSVLLKNKATGELIAEGRHSLCRKQATKL